MDVPALPVTQASCFVDAGNAAGRDADTVHGMRIVRSVAVCVVLVGPFSAAWPGSAAHAVTGPDQDIDASATPWAVGIYAVNGLGDRWLLCSGALIGPSTVLTAAHCVVDSAGAFAAGVISVGIAAAPGSSMWDAELVAVVRAVAHPGYRPRKTTSRHDIAVLELAFPVAVAWLPVAPGDGPAPASLDAFGWGIGSNRQVDGKLGRVDGRPATRRELSGYPRLDPVRQGAATPTGPYSACTGDSGGPVVTGGPLPTLVGVVSYGPIGCGPSPMVFTRVAGYAKWIAEVTET